MKKAVQIVHGDLSPLPDWKSGVLAGPSRHAWFEKIHLRWVPRAPSISQKSERGSYSNLLLTTLMKQKASGFQQTITGEQSWLFLYYAGDSVWAVPRDEPPQRIKQKINTEKCLVLILWSVNGIHSLLDIPKGTRYNTAVLTDVVLPCLIENVGCVLIRRR
jgi:hypothetical protein